MKMERTSRAVSRVRAHHRRPTEAEKEGAAAARAIRVGRVIERIRDLARSPYCPGPDSTSANAAGDSAMSYVRSSVA